MIGRTPGEGSNTFPPGVVLAYPDPGSVEGVAVFEHHVGVGPVASHLAVRYEYGRTVGAQGEGAEKLASIVDGVGYATDVAELAWGTNPHQTLTLDTERNPIDAERHAGTVHVGMGPSPIFGSRTTSRLHLDGLIIKPSIFLDGEPIMTDGHLLVLDLPAVREVAARFGDPDELLRERFPITPDWMAEVSESGPVELGDEWVTLAPPSRRAAAGRALGRPLGPPARAADRARRGHRADGGRALRARALPLQRRARDARGRDLPRRDRPRPHRGRVRPGAGRAADDGARGVRPARRSRSSSRAGSGPVDAQVAGRLWVSGSLGTRVLTSCTFRLLRHRRRSADEEALRDPARHRRGRRREVHGLGARARRALLGPRRRVPDPDRRREERARRHGPLARPHRGPRVPDPEAGRRGDDDARGRHPSPARA